MSSHIDYDVDEAMDVMQGLIRSGQIPKAISLGSKSRIPLAVSSAAISLGKLICEGAESRVFSGVYNGIEVAIKKAIIRNSQDLERFRRELKILALLEHDNIIKVCAAQAVPPDYYMVMPLQSGNMHDAVHHKKYRPSWWEILAIAMQLTSAVESVHSSGIIHRDVKTKNLLISPEGQVKLADFGMAAFCNENKGIHEDIKISVRKGKPSGGFHKSRMVGTLEYMAPEILSLKPHSFASDIYALAVTINEIASGIYPFTDCTKENPAVYTVLEAGYGRHELLAAISTEGLRPTLPTFSPPGYEKLIKACWDLDPLLRPNANQLFNALKNLRDKLDPSIPIDLVLRGFPNSQKLDSNLNSNKMTRLQFNCDFEVSENWKAELGNVKNRKFSVGSFESAGRRGHDKMEDRKFEIYPFLNSNSIALIGVFDGHRGNEASQFAIDHLPSLIEHHLKEIGNIERALEISFMHLEDMFEQSDIGAIPVPKGFRYPGSTALAALIFGDKIYIANLGDCRAVLCSGGQAVQLTRDHTANDDAERNRILAAGASIKKQNGVYRIGDVGLQVTRSLGDCDLKNYGVTAMPEITKWDITEKDKFLVVATDGLFDTFSNEEVVRLVQCTVKQPMMCAQRLATTSIERGTGDNVTTTVIFLQTTSTIEKIYHQENGN